MVARLQGVHTLIGPAPSFFHRRLRDTEAIGHLFVYTDKLWFIRIYRIGFPEILISPIERTDTRTSGHARAVEVLGRLRLLKQFLDVVAAEMAHKFGRQDGGDFRHAYIFQRLGHCAIRRGSDRKWNWRQKLVRRLKRVSCLTACDEA
jgi:hypothetical protein